MTQLVLQSPSAQRTPAGMVFAAKLDDVYLNVTISANSDILDNLSVTPIPFIPIAILIAGQENKSLLIEDCIDDAWWASLVGAYEPLTQRLFDTNEIIISRRGSGRSEVPQSDDVALLFSSGVDSFYSLFKMRQMGVSPKWLININAGAHNLDRSCWAQRLKGIEKVAREIGARVITIDTNFHEIFAADHVKSHLIRNLAAAYALHPVISRFIYSSAHQFEDISFSSAKQMGIDYIDHTVLASFTPNMISTTVLGWDADRIRKTRVIADDPLAQSALDVCTDANYQNKIVDGEPINCGLCMKCIRTMLTLHHFGKLEKFENQFSVPNFNARRNALVEAIAAQNHPVDLAVADLIGAKRPA